MRNTAVVINERRQKVQSMLIRGMRVGEISKELRVDQSTITKDIKHLAGQSQNYLTDLARSTLPLMYQISIESIRDVLKESWKIYESDDSKINWFHKLSALRLAKECNESIFSLLDEGPSVMAVKQLQDRLILIESRQTN